MKVLRGGGQNLGVSLKFTFDFTSLPKTNWNLVMFNVNDVSKSDLIYFLSQTV